MTPEERDRLIILETEFRQYKNTQDEILKLVKSLDKKSTRLSGGIVVLAGIGGVMYFLLQTIASAKIWQMFS